MKRKHIYHKLSIPLTKIIRSKQLHSNIPLDAGHLVGTDTGWSAVQQPHLGVHLAGAGAAGADPARAGAGGGGVSEGRGLGVEGGRARKVRLVAPCAVCKYEEMRRRNDNKCLSNGCNRNKTLKTTSKQAPQNTYLAAPLFTAPTGSLFTSFLVLLVREMRGWLLSTAVVIEVADSAGSVVG